LYSLYYLYYKIQRKLFSFMSVNKGSAVNFAFTKIINVISSRGLFYY